MGNLREGDHLGVTDVNRRIILRWIFKKYNVGYNLDRAGSGQGQVTDTRECGNKPADSIKSGEILD